MITIDNKGKILTETIEYVEMPIDYTFECVNDYVHSVHRTYEELECLCLGMANEIDKLNNLSPDEIKDSYDFFNDISNNK